MKGRVVGFPDNGVVWVMTISITACVVHQGLHHPLGTDGREALITQYGMPEGMEGTHKRAYKRGRRQGITRTGTMKKRQKTQRDTQEAEMDVEGSPRTASPPREEGKRTRTQGITRVGTVRKRRK